jgi:hypothetical protein
MPSSIGERGAELPDHPPFNADQEAWIAWLDEVAPCGGTPLVRDSQLATLCRYRDRAMAAEFAKCLLLQREKDQRSHRTAFQRSLFSDGK